MHQKIEQLVQQQKPLLETGGGLAIAIGSAMADATMIVQSIGIWAGALLAVLGVFSWFEKRYFKKDQ